MDANLDHSWVIGLQTNGASKAATWLLYMVILKRKAIRSTCFHQGGQESSFNQSLDKWIFQNKIEPLSRPSALRTCPLHEVQPILWVDDVNCIHQFMVNE